MSEQSLNVLDTEFDARTVESTPIPAPTAPEPMSMGAVLRVVTMRRLWYAQIVSVFGDFLALFAVITIMTFRLHATPQQITGVNISYLLPIALLGVISGVFVDRWPVKITLVSSDFLRAGLCLGLFFVHNMVGFYVVLASISIISSFFSPAQGVAIRMAIPMHGLRSANALMQQVMFIMRIIGGPVAITIVRIFGAKTCYGLDAFSFLASGSLIASLAITLPAKTLADESSAEAPTSKSGSGIQRILTDMKVGAGFIVHHAALFFVIVALAAGMFVMGCFGPLIAIYVRDTLHASSTIFAVTSAAIGIGLLVGVNALNAFAKHISNTTQVYLGLGGIALGTALLAGRAALRLRDSGNSSGHACGRNGFRLLSHWLRRCWHYRSLTDANPGRDPCGAHGPRRFDDPVGCFLRADRWAFALRHPRRAHQRAQRLRHLHRHARYPHRRRQDVDGTERSPSPRIVFMLDSLRSTATPRERSGRLCRRPRTRCRYSPPSRSGCRN
jgi:DHA3 family macrolide efflux protein-like MFS transporter